MLNNHELQMAKVKEVYLLDDGRLDYYWPDIAELLTSVPGFSELFTADWAYRQAKMGHLQVWALADDKIRAIVLTQVLVFPRAKVFEILAAGGVGLLDFVSEMEDVFTRIAHNSGCSKIQARCRPGLQRKLRGLRLWNESIVLSKPIEITGDQ